MVRASASRAVNLSLIPSRVKPMIKNWCTQLLCLTLSIKRTLWRTSRQVYLLCRWERHLAGFFHLGVVDRWLTTPKRVRYSAFIALSCGRINMKQNTKFFPKIYFSELIVFHIFPTLTFDYKILPKLGGPLFHSELESAIEVSDRAIGAPGLLFHSALDQFIKSLHTFQTCIFACSCLLQEIIPQYQENSITSLPIHH